MDEGSVALGIVIMCFYKYSRTHTPWTAQGMPYEGLCLSRDMLKIDSKNGQKIRKNILE